METPFKIGGMAPLPTMIIYGARSEIPSFTKEKEQLRAEKFEDTCMIASVRFMLSALLEIYVKSILCS